MKKFFVYIATNNTGTLYTGVTNDISARMYQHKSGEGSEFTKKYGIRYLVYVEEASDAYSAIAREKQIKNWRRDKKLRLIRGQNPGWHDLLSS